FEIPSNLILQRVGAKLWIARIMLTWGMIATAMMFVHNVPSFYLLRFLLGVAEAGFFPGIIFYLSLWFPSIERGKTNALFMTAASLSGIVSGPLSGFLLSFDNLGGVQGWQWLFLIEGLPATLFSAVIFFYLPNNLSEVAWLSIEEKNWLIDALLKDKTTTLPQSHRLKEAFKNLKVWLFAAIYFTICIGLYGIGFWLPRLLKTFSTMTDLQLGFVSAIPYLVATVGMVIISSHSDRTQERRWHLVVSLLLAATGLALGSLVSNPILLLLSLTLAYLGVWSSIPTFWTVPNTFLQGTGAAAGIALINSVGNLGGFVGPFLIGLIKQITQHFSGALLTVGTCLLLGACLSFYGTSFLKSDR
ncbi:MAG: MFS transporter, partial [Synechocystis sp.]